jgi:hypothetical protein
MQSHDYVIFLGSEDVMDTDGWMASGRLFIWLDDLDMLNVWHQTFLMTYRLQYNSKENTFSIWQ